MTDADVLKEYVLNLATQLWQQATSGETDEAVKTMDKLEPALDRLIAASQKATR